VQLSEYEPSYCSYGEAFDVNCTHLTLLLLVVVVVCGCSFLSRSPLLQLWRGLRQKLHPSNPAAAAAAVQVRLFEEEPSYCSYGEAYDINCARFGREPDMPIAHFKKRLAAPDGNYDKVRPCSAA
jgi:hypothetical protein